MRINELLSTQQEIDEGVWDQVKGAAKGAWDGMKQGWAAAKTPPAAAGAATAPAATNAAPAASTTAAAPSGSTRPYVAPAASATAAPAATNAASAPTASAPAATGDIGSIMQAIDKLDKPAKQQLAGELEKSINAPAGGDDYSPQELETMNKKIAAMDDAQLAQVAAKTDLDSTVTAAVKAEVEKRKSGQQATTPTDQTQTQQKSANGTAPAGTPPPAPGTAPAAADPATQGTEYDPAKAAADKAAKNQADADQRNADIEKTKQANAAKNQQDAAIKAAADAAKAKPAFQQSASDKLAIKQAADKGIREAEEKKKLKKKKVVAEFKSNFLGRMI